MNLLFYVSFLLEDSLTCLDRIDEFTTLRIILPTQTRKSLVPELVEGKHGVLCVKLCGTLCSLIESRG